MKKPMTLNELIGIASEAYPDDRINAHFDKEKSKPVSSIKANKLGDTLAFFLTRELCETFDSKANRLVQAVEATRVLDMAIREIESVRDAFLTLK
jgi:hypothetical protein